MPGVKVLATADSIFLNESGKAFKVQAGDLVRVWNRGYAMALQATGLAEVVNEAPAPVGESDTAEPADDAAPAAAELAPEPVQSTARPARAGKRQQPA